jgi:hypothetical protein
LVVAALGVDACGKNIGKPKSPSGKGVGLPLTGNGDAQQGWSSSGGGVIMDSTNPWFLAENTPEVTYCIKVDEPNFGIGADVVDQQIQQSISFWDTAFKSSGVLRLSHFTRKACDDGTSTVITFLMGDLDLPHG